MPNPLLRAVGIVVCASVWVGTGCGGEGVKEFGGESSGGRPGMAGAGGDDGAGGRGGAGEAMTGGRDGGNSGTGGNTATGGGNGSGGAVASGGNHATGGATGSGGAPASGGRVGSGGAAATGGRMGSGGVSGSGGRAGTGGGSGGGGPNGAVCDQLAADYQRELPSAKACSLVALVKQCQIEMPSRMGCGSSCTIFVQTADKLMAIQTSWQKNGCDDIIRLCPAIACVRPEPGRCAIAAGIVTAECQ